MTAAPGPQQPDEVRKVWAPGVPRAVRRGCTCLCHESGPPDEHMGRGEKCPCKRPAAPSAQPVRSPDCPTRWHRKVDCPADDWEEHWPGHDACAVNSIGWCVMHRQAHWRCAAQPDRVTGQGAAR